MTNLQQRVGDSTGSPWGVQISAGFSRERVMESYAALERREREALEGFDPVILQTLLRSRGTRPFYQVRIGTATRESANTLCARLAKRERPAWCCATAGKEAVTLSAVIPEAAKRLSTWPRCRAGRPCG